MFTHTTADKHAHATPHQSRKRLASPIYRGARRFEQARKEGGGHSRVMVAHIRKCRAKEYASREWQQTTQPVVAMLDTYVLIVVPRHCS